MAKRIVVCCDGTGNQIERNISNVLKLFRIAVKDDEQTVFYDPGIGTLGQYDAWARIRQSLKGFFGLMTGWGLDDNVLNAYRFILRNFDDGDQIFLFGFSRGAYTARVLAGFIHMVGLLRPQQENICDYALAAYKQASERNDFRIAWQFQRVSAARRVRIRFLAVWDTVNSVLTPRPDRFYIPSLESLPYTKTNPSVEIFRHAIAIDECRRMFRVADWTDPQPYVANPFDANAPAIQQDIKQVWFAGVHSDIGSGYPESESGLSKFPLRWMLNEAKAAGLNLNTAMFNNLVEGQQRANSALVYSVPDVKAMLHDSMTWAWRILEYIPKRTWRREWPRRRSFLGWYLPHSEPRALPENARIHSSVVDKRANDSTYRPINVPATLPATWTIEP